MKKLATIILSLMMVFAIYLPVAAANDQERIIDDAGLLTSGEVSELSELLDEISERQQMDIVIVTVDSLGSKSATAFADDYFDYNGYGMGSNRSGILFLISMEYRDWAISTRGSAINVFTDATQSEIMDAISSNLSGGNYYAAFTGFANQCDEIITEANTFPAGKYLLIALVLGAIVGGIQQLILRGELKSVAAKDSAVDYVVPGSLNMHTNRDLFLYRTVHTQHIERSSGSSTHTSSSGATHGGSSGKF